MNTLIFVHGFLFADARSGLARRTQLMFRILGECGEFSERILASPRESEESEKSIQASGWGRVWTQRYTDWKKALGPFKFIYFLRRLLVSWGMRLNGYWQNSALTSFGGADLRPTRELIALLRAKPGAAIWLARCDLLHLTPYLRDDQLVILDSNDSVANLVSCYDLGNNFRKAAGLSLPKAANLLARAELRLAQRCDLILAISQADLAFFGQGRGPEVLLEESCIASTAEADVTPSHEYDVGFLGGSYKGAVAAAMNLIKLAQDPDLSHYKFAIAGQVCEELQDTVSSNVAMVGGVADSTRFMASCKQVVLWSNQETGTSVKFQEAILSGTTVLANENASRWSFAVPGRDYLLCETIEEVRIHILLGSTIQADHIRSHASMTSIASRVLAALRRARHPGLRSPGHLLSVDPDPCRPVASL